jgi:hypothetical protein
VFQQEATAMELRDDLLKMEKQLWSGGQREYRDALDSDCLVAFTEMAGVSSRDAIASQASANRWHDVDIDVDGLLRPTDDVAILTYHVHAVREQNMPYDAVVSSGYVRRDGAWKMMFHQQTPLGNAGARKEAPQ